MSNRPKTLGNLILPPLPVAFAYIDVPYTAPPGGSFGRNPEPVYRVALALTEEQCNEVLALVEPYMAQTDAMYPNTPRDTHWGLTPETKSKNDKTPTGRYLLNFENRFPVRVFDENKNLVDPPPKITRGSIVQLNIGLNPYEFNGKHGISRTRLYDMLVVEMAQDSRANPFGESTGAPTLAPGSAPAAPQRQQPFGGGGNATQQAAAPQNTFLPPTAPTAPPAFGGAPQAPVAAPAGLPDFDDDIPF